MIFLLLSLTLFILISFFNEFLYLLVFGLIVWFIIFLFTFEYASILLAYLCLGLEENLIVHDSSDWAWALIYISFFFSTFFTLPYFLYLIYIWFANFLFKKEITVFLFHIFFYLYLQILILLIVFNDIVFSTFFYIPKLNNIFFEFQLDLENYLYLILGFFFDLNKSFVFIQVIILVFFFFKYFIFNLKYENLLLFLCSFLNCYYWFGGESLNGDLLIFLIVFIIIELIYFLKLFFLNLRRYI